MNKVIFLFLFILGIVYPAFAQEVYQAHTHVRLVSEQDNVAAAGYSVMVGFDFILDDGWHMYWKNPGDSGLAPKIKWDLPDSVKAGGIVQWPYPERINVGPLTSYGYEHELLLLVPILVDGQYQASKPVNLHATVNWLTCKDICIPGKAEFNLSLPMVSGVGSVKYNHFKNVFNETRQKWPELSTETSARAVLEGNQWHLLVQSPYKNHGEVFFYPFRDDVIEHSALQRLKMTPDGYELYLTKSHLSQGILKSLDGVLVNSAGWFYPKMKAIEIHAPIELAPLRISFILACLFAFIGGLILNLMPCVLPVLSIKVLHLIERHPDRSIALRHSLMYALGILVSVWSLALLLFILKSAGQFAGWGFQFQSPVFVIIVALILFVLALNLFGVFEFTVPAINGLPSKEAGYEASFISGVITTIVASPCTAPFMGTALTLAISQPNIVGFGVFTSLGLGLASPFVLLSAFPFLLSFVPKPGLWMINLKRFLGLILLACVIWMVWVFGIETGIGDLSRFIKSSAENHWHAFSASAVNQARQSGHGVFIDFTADWCINCQVNDRLVLQNKKVEKAFKDHGIILFKADWTKYDPSITQALASYGRDSIPVYIYYPPGSSQPILLSQIITPYIILDFIKKGENHA